MKALSVPGQRGSLPGPSNAPTTLARLTSSSSIRAFIVSGRSIPRRLSMPFQSSAVFLWNIHTPHPEQVARTVPCTANTSLPSCTRPHQWDILDPQAVVTFCSVSENEPVSTAVIPSVHFLLQILTITWVGRKAGRKKTTSRCYDAHQTIFLWARCESAFLLRWSISM